MKGASLLGAIAATAGVSTWYLGDLLQARRRIAGRAHAAKTPFGSVEYAIVGHGAPTLVIHGASGGFDQSLDMLGALADHGRLIIAPSRFGYLGSSMPADANTEKQADAYAALLDFLGHDAADVIAVSAGAWSALSFAIRHAPRCRSLILLVPADRLPDGVENRGGAFVRAFFGSDLVAWATLKVAPFLPAVLTALLGTNARLVESADPAERQRIRTLLAHLMPVSARRRGTEFDIQVAQRPPFLAVERIACPVLAISADDDLFDTADRVRRLVAATTLGAAVIFPSGGHALVGRHDATLKHVTTFLAASKGGPRSLAPPANRSEAPAGPD